MKKSPILWAFIALVLLPVAAIALTSQRAQMAVSIIINVTPNPLGYVPGHSGAGTIIARASLHDAPPEIERAFEAQQLHFVVAGGGMVVAQAKQKAVEVEAEVTPNPNATLLTFQTPPPPTPSAETGAANGTVIINAEAGIPTFLQCAYMVEVDTAVNNWQLKDGLFTDFSNGSTTFSGNDVSHATYVSAPAPASTAFVVYSDNGGVWSVVNGTYSGVKNFCVDLTLNIPIATPQGQYSSNAVYTLYY